MALDSKEIEEFMAKLALSHGLDAIILRPEASKAWEYNKKGKLVKRDISPLQTTEKGRRCYCIPDPDKGEGMWTCGVYNEGKTQTELSRFTTQLPG